MSKMRKVPCPIFGVHYTHALFGNFHQAHVDARAINPSLVDPSDSKFRYDFGRIGFKENLDRIDIILKLREVEKVRTALKTVWKMN